MNAMDAQVRDLPPRQQLRVLLRALGRRFPQQMGILLDDVQFERGRNALLRLADADWAQQAVMSMSPQEAAEAAKRLWALWSALATPVLEPMIVLELPSDVWIAEGTVRVPITFAVLGVDTGWSASWSGPVVQSAHPVLLLSPPPSVRPEAWRVHIAVTVRATHRDQVLTLRAQGQVRLRRATLRFSLSRRSLTILDQEGEPARGTRVQIGTIETFTNDSGQASLDQASTGAVIRLGNVVIGAVPDLDHSLEEPTVEIRRDFPSAVDSGS